MALVLKDRVKQITDTVGTGSLSVTSVSTGYQTFSDAIGNGNTTYYAIYHENTVEWEVGIGTVGSGTLSRDTVLASSNSGSLVNFTSGNKAVWCDYPASKAVYADQDNKLRVDGNPYVDFQSAAGTPVAAGRMWYDQTEGNWNLGMGGGNITQQVGEELFLYGKASDAITDSPLQIVYQTGVVGASGHITFGPTVAGITDGNLILGCATEPIAKNGFGRITTYGTIHNITTNGSAYGETWADGDIIWYNPTTGNPTNVKPSAPNIKVQLGIITHAGSGGSGSFFVLVQPGSTLGGTDSNVTITSPTSGQQLIYNGSVWTNSNSPTITGGSINNAPIGASTASTGKFTTLEATGTSSLGTASAQYIQAVGDATYPQVKAAGSGTNIPLVLQPKGTGALQAQLTDSTATGGNARGANAVDWQTARATAAQVASGQLSFVGGGTNNTASQYNSSVACGFQNTVSGIASFVGSGSTNTMSGNYGGIVTGTGNIAAGYMNFIGGGFINSGTSGSAVTTQSGTMNGTTAVTLSGSNASIKVGQYITGTSIAAETYVAAISGTALTLSKNASGSSTSTLSFFTPHGVVVGGGNNQATGSYSFIGGGGDAGTAGNRNVASGDWSAVLGGFKNTASGFGAWIGTNNNTAGANVASGAGSVVLSGTNNTASASSCSILFGYGNSANGNYGSANGVGSTNRTLTSTFAFGSLNISKSGDAQMQLATMGTQTTDATATVLTFNNSAASTNNQAILPNNSAYYFRGEIVAGVTGGGNTKGWFIEGVIKRGANAASTALVGTPTVTSNYADAGASTWTIAVTADTTNGGLKVTATGQAATTIRWVCKLVTTEMTF